MSWVGFTSTDREGALKLLTISASAGQDVHSAFAALTLLTFYGLILLRTQHLFPIRRIQADFR